MNVLLDTPDTLLAKIEDLLKSGKEKSAKGYYFDVEKIYELTEEELARGKALEKKFGRPYAEQHLLGICTREKRQRIEKNAARPFSSRRKLMVRLLEIGLAHVDEV